MKTLVKSPMLIVFLGLFLLIAGGCREGWVLEDEPRVRVDFQDVFGPKETPFSRSEGSTTRIAVAAMISPQYTYEYYAELLESVGQRMGTQVDLVQKKTYAQVNAMLKHREIEIGFVCAGPYVEGKKDFGMEPLVVPVVNGKRVYHSYFIVHKDSPVQAFAQLRGKAFAFTDPHSNTGCLVPTYVLARRNETPQGFFGETLFSYSHDNSIKMVAEGRVDGAAVDSLIWEFMDHVNPEFTSRTKIIETSPGYAIPPIVVHPDLDAQRKEKIRQVFLSFHEDPRGREILSRLQIDRFEPARDEDFDSVRQMQRWLSSGAERTP